MNPLCRVAVAFVLSSIMFATAEAAQDGWIVLSDDLKAWQEPTGEWFLAGGARVDPQNDRRLVGEPGRGTIVNGKTGKTDNLITRQQWGDVEVQLEFMIPRKSNSGVKLEGVYEIQIYDSFGTTNKLTGADCGGVYPRGEPKPRYHHLDDGIAPRVNAAKPAGQWQGLHIVFRAPRVDAGGKKTANARFEKVLLNGQLIHDQVELQHPTGNVWKDKENATGPLLLQADHGPVAFRNVRVRPLTPAK
jgi:hypothetical protein